MNRDRAHLLYIQQSIVRIQRLANEGKVTFLNDEDKQAAILYYLQTLSESATRISESLRNTQPQIAWAQIRGFRNRVAHDYLSIDLELVWQIITSELTPLFAAITTMTASLPPEDEPS